MTAANPVSLATTVRASESQISCEVADEVVLLSVRDGQYYGLNAVGASVWRLIQEPRTVGEVRDALLHEYEDVSPETCAHEVMTFVASMLELGLIEQRGERT
jgi:hypothetical protein